MPISSKVTMISTNVKPHVFRFNDGIIDYSETFFLKDRFSRGSDL
jgi:hypothetical protein